MELAPRSGRFANHPSHLLESSVNPREQFLADCGQSLNCRIECRMLDTDSGFCSLLLRRPARWLD